MAFDDYYDFDYDDYEPEHENLVCDCEFNFIRATSKAYLFAFRKSDTDDYTEHWIPISQCEYDVDDNTLYVSEWFYNKTSELEYYFV